MTNDTKTHRTTKVLLAVLVSGALLLTVPTASANENHEYEKGELRVLDDLGDRRHDRHVTCDFWVAGLDMPADNGTLVIKRLRDRATVVEDEWEANQGGNFLNGPYRLEPGRYVVKAFFEPEFTVLNSEDRNGEDRKVSAADPKEFVVDVAECEPCPTDLDAEAMGNGDIRLTFTPAEGADATLVYRTEGDQDAERVAVLSGNATSFVDTDTVPGTTYTYEVRHAFGERESEDCPMVEVTAIPVFPTLLGAVAASTVGVLAYAGLRRRV